MTCCERKPSRPLPRIRSSALRPKKPPLKNPPGFSAPTPGMGVPYSLNNPLGFSAGVRTKHPESRADNWRSFSPVRGRLSPLVPRAKSFLKLRISNDSLVKELADFSPARLDPIVHLSQVSGKSPVGGIARIVHRESQGSGGVFAGCVMAQQELAAAKTPPDPVRIASRNAARPRNSSWNPREPAATIKGVGKSFRDRHFPDSCPAERENPFRPHPRFHPLRFHLSQRIHARTITNNPSKSPIADPSPNMLGFWLILAA